MEQFFTGRFKEKRRGCNGAAIDLDGGFSIVKRTNNITKNTR